MYAQMTQMCVMVCNIKTFTNNTYMYYLYHVYELNADTYKYRSICIGGSDSVSVTSTYHMLLERMDSEPKISDISSDCSTQILPDNTVNTDQVVLYKKISIIKDNMKMQLFLHLGIFFVLPHAINHGWI